MMRLDPVKEQLNEMVSTNCELKDYLGKGYLKDYISVAKLYAFGELTPKRVRKFFPNPLYCVHPFQQTIWMPNLYEGNREYNNYTTELKTTLRSAVGENRTIVAFIETENIEDTLNRLNFLKDHDKLLIVPTKESVVETDAVAAGLHNILMYSFLRSIKGEKSEIIGEIDDMCVSRAARGVGIQMNFKHPALYRNPSPTPF